MQYLLIICWCKYLCKSTIQYRKCISPQQYQLQLHAVTHAVNAEILKEQLPLGFSLLKAQQNVSIFIFFSRVWYMTNTRPLWQEHFDNWKLSAHALPRHSGLCSLGWAGSTGLPEGGPAAPNASLRNPRAYGCLGRATIAGQRSTSSIFKLSPEL